MKLILICGTLLFTAACTTPPIVQLYGVNFSACQTDLLTTEVDDISQAVKTALSQLNWRAQLASMSITFGNDVVTCAVKAAVLTWKEVARAALSIAIQESMQHGQQYLLEHGVK